jgi:hypothetical protein
MNWNDAQIHLMVNHMPILGSVFAILILLWGTIRKSQPIIGLGLVFLIFCAGFAFLADKTGENANQYLRDQKLLKKGEVKEHAQAADWASYLLYGTGLLSLIAVSFKKLRSKNWLLAIIVVIGGMGATAMVVTGLHGGKIMHKEVRDNAGIIGPETPANDSTSNL